MPPGRNTRGTRESQTQGNRSRRFGGSNHNHRTFNPGCRSRRECDAQSLKQPFLGAIRAQPPARRETFRPECGPTDSREHSMLFGVRDAKEFSDLKQKSCGRVGSYEGGHEKWRYSVCEVAGRGGTQAATAPSAQAPEPGGTSGITVDNVSDEAGGTKLTTDIYFFSAQSGGVGQTCAKYSGGTVAGDCAVV
jgi:hypothetical protein